MCFIYHHRVVLEKGLFKKKTNNIFGKVLHTKSQLLGKLTGYLAAVSTLIVEFGIRLKGYETFYLACVSLSYDKK